MRIHCNFLKTNSQYDWLKFVGATEGSISKVEKSRQNETTNKVKQWTKQHFNGHIYRSLKSSTTVHKLGRRHIQELATNGCVDLPTL
jgi:hypothetical protein